MLPIRTLAAVVLGLALSVAALVQPLSAADTLDAYAPPNFWGKYVNLRAHLGAANYKVSYRALGKTQVIGEVTYFAPDGKEKVEQFLNEISFTTQNAVAQPKVRFRGVPLGSAVVVTVK